MTAKACNAAMASRLGLASDGSGARGDNDPSKIAGYKQYRRSREFKQAGRKFFHKARFLEHQRDRRSLHKQLIRGLIAGTADHA
jgi:hypothetical protein